MVALGGALRMARAVADRRANRAIASALELLVAASVVVFDVAQPTLVILVLIAGSLLLRHDSLRSLGFKRLENLPRTLGVVLVLVVLWQLLHLGLTMPLLNRLTGATQDLSDFAALKGNVGQLLLLLALSWSIAGIGEEMVYRGYMQRRALDLFGETKLGLAVAIALSSVLFGLAHTEQGVIGVVVTVLDALFFSAVKWKYGNNLWAAVLAHALGNTIGIVAFFFVGPIYGFW